MPPGRKSTAHFGHGERFYRDAAVGTDRLFHNTVRLFRTFGQHLGFLLQTQEAKHTKHQTDQSHYQVNNPHGVLLLVSNRQNEVVKTPSGNAPDYYNI